ARAAIRNIHAKNPATRIIVTGCYAQRAPEELAALAGVSRVVGNTHKPQIPDLVASSELKGNFVSTASLLPPATLNQSVWARHAVRAFTRSADVSLSPQILVGDIFDYHQVLVAPVLGGEGNHTRPTLKIQDGCNNRCAFCVIPFVRGKSRS